jgi:hypothetical protein
VVNFDTVLHHVIDPGGYGRTIAGIGELLASLRRHMSGDGTIMIREIYHEFRPWRSLGCRMLYYLTCTQLPGPVARLIRWAGIKTANVGVCFLTRGQWRGVFSGIGLRIVAASELPWKSPLRFLGISSGETYYYLRWRG